MSYVYNNTGQSNLNSVQCLHLTGYLTLHVILCILIFLKTNQTITDILATTPRHSWYSRWQRSKEVFNIVAGLVQRVSCVQTGSFVSRYVQSKRTFEVLVLACVVCRLYAAGWCITPITEPVNTTCMHTTCSLNNYGFIIIFPNTMLC